MPFSKKWFNYTDFHETPNHLLNLCTALVLNFIQTGRKVQKLWAEFHIIP
jgi:hypothetical protein